MKSFILLFFSVFVFVHFSAGKIEYSRYTEKMTRKTVHVPKVLAKTCLLKPDEGPCRGNIPMYYFQPRNQTCMEFKWGGCQGNGNRYDTIEDCNNTCLSKADTPNKRPNWCSLAFDYGFCFGAIERYYFDSRWKVCKKTIYSGCGGNKNNFYNKEQCDSICRFGKGPLSITRKPRDGGKKILIVNPWNTTPRRGLGLTSTKKSNFTKFPFSILNFTNFSTKKYVGAVTYDF